MQHTIENPTSVERKITFNFEADEVNTYIDSAIKEIGKTVTLDGFRKGKVPAKVIESRFAQDVISRASDAIVNTNIQSVISENEITPISRIQFVEIEGNENNEIKRDGAYTFAVTFEVLPQIDLPVLEDLKINELRADVSAQELEDFSRRLRQTSATLKPVEEERLPKDYDVCVVDVEGTFEGKPVLGLKAENIHMQLKPESDPLSTEIEAIVRSMNVGEEKTGKVSLSQDFPDPQYRNMQIDMRVKLHSISEEELPALDEEFAKKFGFETMDKLHVFMFNNIITQNKQTIKVDTQNKLLDQVLADLEYDLPQTYVAAHKSEYLMEARNFLMKQGQEPEKMSESIRRMEDEAEVEARKQAKAQAFLMALAIREKIVISDKEVQEYVFRAAQESGQDPKETLDRLYQSGTINDIHERLMAAKALELMYKKAAKTPVDKDGNAIIDEVIQEKDEAVSAEAAEENPTA